MVHLKRVDPFEENMMKSISYFSYQRSFYDCINRKFLEEEAFQNLEYTFHTYLLTGDSNEWIGYILFSNPDLVKSYFEYAYYETIILLDTFQKEFENDNNQNIFKKLRNLTTKLKKTIRISVIIDEVVAALTDLEVLNSNTKAEILSNYHQKLENYFNSFPNYYYLDVVISLPLEEEFILKKENINSILSTNSLAERKYYGFIQEVLSKVDDEIQKSFPSIPILIKGYNNKIVFTNTEEIPSNIPVIKKTLKSENLL